MESSVFGVASSEEDEDALISSDVFRMFSFKVRRRQGVLRTAGG